MAIPAYLCLKDDGGASTIGGQDHLLVTDLVALQKDLNSLTAFVDAYGSNDKSDSQLKELQDSIDNIKSLMNIEGEE